MIKSGSVSEWIKYQVDIQILSTISTQTKISTSTVAASERARGGGEEPEQSAEQPQDDGAGQGGGDRAA